MIGWDPSGSFKHISVSQYPIYILPIMINELCIIVA